MVVVACHRQALQATSDVIRPHAYPLRAPGRVFQLNLHVIAVRFVRTLTTPTRDDILSCNAEEPRKKQISYDKANRGDGDFLADLKYMD